MATAHKPHRQRPDAAVPGDDLGREWAGRDFLAANINHLAAVEALPADASPRRYFRLAMTPKLLMQVEPGSPELTAFIEIAAHLNRLGLSAPRVFDIDPRRGMALIEDFGTQTFTRLLGDGHDERRLYELATDTLVALHEHPDAASIAVPPYDEGPLSEELEMFTGWFAPVCASSRMTPSFADEFLGEWRIALAPVSGRREAFVLRDYHVDNLMVIDGRDGVAACGLLDFQDALLGPAAYDLVSLTQDARRDLAPGLEPYLIERYLAARPSIDRALFLRDYWLLAAHRHTKIAGNFERLSKRDGKHGYLVHMPRVLRLLDRALDKAGLDRIRQLMDLNLPGWRHYAVVDG